MFTTRAIGKAGLYLMALHFPLAAVDCDSLASLKLLNTSITAAHMVTGTFQPPEPAPAAADLAAYQTLPAFCRVQGVIEPTSDSHIEFEVWLPKETGTADFKLSATVAGLAS